MSATAYSSGAILSQFLLGIPAASPSLVYISLHTADPGATGDNEITSAQWPSYARLESSKGAGKGKGFSAPADIGDGSGLKQSSNLLDLYWKPLDGPNSLTLTHAAIWDSQSGGNCLAVAALAIVKKLDTSDEVVFHTGQIIVKVI